MVAQIDRKFIATRSWKIWPRMVAYLLFEGRPLTTSGRWINSVVFGLYRLWAMIPFAPIRQPVFILGMGRSGTTILGKILGLHRDIGYLNEPKALWHSALGDDDLIGSYSTAPGRYKMGRSDANTGKIRRLNRYYAAFLWLSGSRRIADKYPELLFRTEFLECCFKEPRKVAIIRNGADVCGSVGWWSQTHGDQKSDWWGLADRKWQKLVTELVNPDPWFQPALSVITGLQDQHNRAAVEWIVTMREVRRQMTEGDIFVLSYEHLLEYPDQALSDLCAYCALPDDDRMRAYARDVLVAKPAHPHPELHPAIQPLFNATMHDFGYQLTDAA